MIKILKYVREEVGDDREGRMSSYSGYLCARQEGCAYPIRNWKAWKGFFEQETRDIIINLF